MTPEQAQDIADRTLAAIDHSETYNGDPAEAHHLFADRERVQSDLAGLRLHLHEPPSPEGWCTRCGYSERWCDAARYDAGLRRTARLYGVELRDDDHA